MGVCSVGSREIGCFEAVLVISRTVFPWVRIIIVIVEMIGNLKVKVRPAKE